MFMKTSYVNVTFLSCTFLNSKAVAIHVFQTNVIFWGDNTLMWYFKTAVVVLVQGSIVHELYLKPHTNQLLTTNHIPSVGGAVYTDLTLESPGLTLSCFFQVSTEGQKEVISTISVEFVNITAARVSRNSCMEVILMVAIWLASVSAHWQAQIL